MDGLGNDFIIFDNRKNNIVLEKKQLLKIADRNQVGCDQIIFIHEDNNSDAFITFYNSDGNETSACGNGSRCIAYFLGKEKNKKIIKLKTKDRILESEIIKENLVKINMGAPKFSWKEIPLSKNINHANLNISILDNNNKEHMGGFSLNVGNPHVIFFVKKIKNFDLDSIGPKIENHKLFPEKCNVTLAEIKNKKLISVNVWERGAGLTKACGTAACATAIAANKMNLSERVVDIQFELGNLNIEWSNNENIYMCGKVSDVKNIDIKL